MIVLAVETASPGPAVALFQSVPASSSEGGFEETAPLGERATESLAHLVRLLLSRRDLALRDIDRIAVLTGPGSFTGLRAGAAFARGLSRGLGVPLFAYPTFEAVSLILPEPADADFMLDAGRGDVHRASRRARSLEPPRLVSREEAVRRAREDGVPLHEVGALSLPFSLAAALARLSASAPPEAATRLVAPLGYGRPSAAEERFGPPGGNSP